MQQLIDNYLHDLANGIYGESAWQPVQLTDDWAGRFARRAGIFIFREAATICYVGETNNLYASLHRLASAPTHTLRTKLRRAHPLPEAIRPLRMPAPSARPPSVGLDQLLEDRIHGQLRRIDGVVLS